MLVPCGLRVFIKKNENNLVGSVHSLHVHTVVKLLCLVSLLIICQLHNWSMNTVGAIIPPLWGEEEQSHKNVVVFFLIFCYLCEGPGNWLYVKICDS